MNIDKLKQALEIVELLNGDSSPSKSSVPSYKVGDKVLITTAWRGIFAGEFVAWEDDAHTIVHLKNFRNCLYWEQTLGGFVGLKAQGPTSKCRIGALGTAPMRFREVTADGPLETKAVESWRDAPVYTGG